MNPAGACAACGSPLSAEAALTCTTATGDHAAYHRCARCRFLTLRPQPSAAELLQHYSEAYYGLGRSKFPRLLEWLRGHSYRKLASQVADAVPSGHGAVLDIGCGSGRFLAEMARRGFEIAGTEVAGPAAERARGLAGVTFREGALRADSFAPAAFDAVTLWHVLEHVPDPADLLDCCRRFLKPGGRLLLEVPNLDSLQARLTGSAWMHLDPPRHLHQFTGASLHGLLARRGFVIESQSTFSLQMGGFGFLQSIANLLLRPRDLFYRLLVTRGQVEASTWRKVAACVLAAALLPLAYAATALEAGLGRGAVLRVCARRAPSGPATTARRVR